MIGVALLSALVLSGFSLRLDEAQSLMQTSQSPFALLYQLGQNVHVPLYHLTLHAWQVLVGSSVPAARTLSLLFFLASIPLMYAVGARAFSREVGLIAAVLLAASPVMNWFGSEIRMYTLLVLVTLANQYFFFGVYARNDERSWAGYLATALVGIFTHYFFFLSLLSQAAFYLAARATFPRLSFGRFALVAGVLALSFLPWVVHVLRLQATLGANAEPQLPVPTTVNLFNTFSAFIFGFQTDPVNTVIVSLWPLLLIFGLFVLRRRMQYPPLALYLAISFLLPILTAFAASATVIPLFETRYLLVSVPAFYLLIAWLLTQYPRSVSRFLTVGLVAAMLVSLAIQTASARTPVKEDYRAAAQLLTERARPDDVIVISAPFTIYPIEYYYRGQARLETIPSWNPYTSSTTPTFVPESLPAEVERVSGSRNRVWLLLSYDQGYEEDVRMQFETRFKRLEHYTFPSSVELYLYQTRY